MPQALVVDSTWGEQSLSPKICLDTHLVCKPLGTPAPPYESYTSTQPTTQCRSCPWPHIPLLNLGQRDDLKKVSAQADLLLCSCRTFEATVEDGDDGAVSRLPAPRHVPSSQMGTALPAAHAWGGKHLPIIRCWGSQPGDCQGPGKAAELRAQGRQQSSLLAFGRARARIRALAGELARMEGGK